MIFMVGGDFLTWLQEMSKLQNRLVQKTDLWTFLAISVYKVRKSKIVIQHC